MHRVKKILSFHDGQHQSVVLAAIESLQYCHNLGLQFREAPLCLEASQLLTIAAQERPDLVLIAGDLPDLVKYTTLIDGLSNQGGSRPIMVSTGSSDACAQRQSESREVVLTTPNSLANTLQSCLAGCLRVDDLLQPLTSLKEQVGLRHLIGNSPEFLDEVKKIPKIARFEITVLITGETGTGKEVFARAIHYLSPRAEGPFVPVNCGAIPADLVENELFGHEQGAFTNATSRKNGLVQEANGGTLFLDEVDCLPLLAQVKVLRFLQENEYRPLGSSTLHKSDVRIIAAANADLSEALRNGRLRRDLFYRLDIMRLILPPLKRRGDDITLLAQHFLSKYAMVFGKNVASFAADAMRQLLLHDWPGNVRELENTIQRAVILSQHEVIQPSDVILDHPYPETVSPRSFNEMKREIVSRFERSYIRDLLAASKGNVTRAAQAAKKNRRAFLELMRKHGIDKATITGMIPFIAEYLAETLP